MRDTKFFIWFRGNPGRFLIKHAMCVKDAAILACADRIKDGLPYEFYRMEEVKDGERVNVDLSNYMIILYDGGSK